MIEHLVTREQWGAARPRSWSVQHPGHVRFLVIHYSAMLADQRELHAECAARVRGIQRYHMTSDQLTPGGASDIGYSWLVCRHGYVFKGRGFRRLPAATGGANSYTQAVCFLGADRVGRDDVTPKGRAAIREVLAFLQRNAPNLKGVRGHRDFGATSCPGDELNAFAKRLDAELRGE